MCQGGREQQAGLLRSRPEEEPDGVSCGASGAAPRDGTVSPISDPPSRGGNQSLDGTQYHPAEAPRTRDGRVRWTEEENILIMRTHFIAQELQQTTGRTYREILTTIWNEIKPERQSYPNLLSNRVRRMLESGKFSRVELNNIERSTRPFAPVPEDEDQNTECSPSETLTHQETDVNNETSQKRSKIQQIFESNLQMYTRISPQERPQIPRLKGSRKILESVQSVNDIIGTILSSQSNLEETTDYVYAGAITVCEVNKIRLRSTEPTPRRETTPPWKIRLETKIKNIRKKIGKLHTYLQTDSPTRKLLKSIHRISSEIHIQEEA
ncbi:uncharacterized protein LOC123680280 [Harmonia axyridis]|uniref:uncharacterized protein LOC123680280 n=1 Tax=Harmonia axyridis TaxID=115357 RepID=UPI001E277017|nr:uncharacterized protein LOC123680280 [Harmonia axyridis]